MILGPDDTQLEVVLCGKRRFLGCGTLLEAVNSNSNFPSMASPYHTLQYAGVVAPSCETPSGIDQPLNLPDTSSQRSMFEYDFAIEREAIKIAKESKKMEAESKQHREEYTAAKELESREKEEKEEKKRLALEVLRLKEEKARAASQLRQRSVAQQQKEEEERKAEEDGRQERVLLRSTSRQEARAEDDRQQNNNQRERELIQQFLQWTGASEDECRHYLTAYAWKLDAAVRAYFGRTT